MIFEKVIGNTKDTDVGNLTPDAFYINWHDTGKKLLRGTTDKGIEIGIKLTEGVQVGDILYMDEHSYIYVDVYPCELTRVTVSSITEMGRLCFELGNRHLSLAIFKDHVDVPYDEPTFVYLKHKGFAPEKICEKFTNYTVCHGHDQNHHHHHES